MKKRGTHNKIKNSVLCKRSISPVIATVLLIAIVVVMAVIIFVWARSFFQESGTKFGRDAEQVCNDINLDATLDGTSLSIINNGNIPIKNLTLQKTKEGSTDIQTTGELGVGASNLYDIGKVYEKVAIIPTILVEIKGSEVEHVCKSYKKEVMQGE